MARSRSLVVVGVLTALCWASVGLYTTARAEPQLAGVPAAQTPKPAPQSTKVYVTKTGEKYHLGTCRSLRQSRLETTVADAKRRGFTACKVCKPPS